MALYRRLIKFFIGFMLAAAIIVPALGMNIAAATTTWTQTTLADFTSGTLVQLDATSSPGDVKLAQSANGYVYAFRGNNTKTFWRYDVAANSWTALADAPQNVGAGGALAFDGNNYIYALSGNGQKYFWRYNITTNTWLSLASTSNPVNAGGALVYTGSYLYAFRGGGQKTFWCYNISKNSWSSMASTSAAVSGGGALTWGGGDFIYALGGASSNFWRYSITGNSWSTKASTPSSVGDGGSLASDGGNYVYALKGGNTVTFWRYNITANSWTAMADTPATPCVYGGGALVYDSNAHLYALRGNSQTDFWKYDVSSNNWGTMTSVPSAVAYGGALAFKPGSSYYTSGTLTSSTYDTGSASDFGTISWTAVTPASTTIQFQIATNNDSATWNYKGPDGTSGTYYTSSGATIRTSNNPARYIRYKAFFSTTNTAVTPVLNDISITYNPHIFLPTATTNAATLVEETTATLHGTVAGDGGESCQYRFVYGTSPGVYTYDTGWTGSVTTGQNFSLDISGLSQGTLYYFAAQVKNSAGIGTGSELSFLTKPEVPTELTATAANSTQINLHWTKGIGALKTLVRRSTGNYPVDRNHGDLVYFDTVTNFSDAGLTAGTTYYYRAWSEVTAGSLQQWSDDYASITAATTGAPTATTNAATLVEETTATLHGTVASSGGESCQYRFVYGTSPGVYTYTTDWTGSVTTGQNFSVDISGLSQGTLYYFAAQVKNSAGIGTGSELSFLTKPEAPTKLTAVVASSTQINLSWTKGIGANRTKVMRKAGSYPTDYNDGTPAYFDTGTNFSDTGLTAGTTYYYRAWSEVTAGSLQQWSDDSAEISAATNSAPSATTNAADSVEETTATLHGSVAADGGETCKYRFTYGTSPGVYSYNTLWIDGVITGQSFSAPITGLSQGTLYYFAAQVKNSAGIGTGSELSFLTKPEAPTELTAVVASSTQINISWTKGIGANRTKVMRKAGSYPTDYNDNDSTLVYFGIGSNTTDDGLSSETEYYYRAWSEVTAGSLQQWSDDYASIIATTTGAPAAITNEATLVEETTATLNGTVDSSGGESCQYRFVYGTSPGVYTYTTEWMGSVTTGQDFSVDISGLSQGTVYYFAAQVKNSVGIGTGSELSFLTKPERPDPFVATTASDTQIDVNWTKGVGALRTMIRRSTSGYPVNRDDGDLVYFDTDTDVSDTDLTADTMYYYRSWSEVTAGSLQQWSDNYNDTAAQTSPPPTTTPPTTTPPTTTPPTTTPPTTTPPTTTPPTTTPPTTTPTNTTHVSVGGVVYPIDKMQVMLPWFALFGFILLVGGAVACKLIMVKFNQR